MPFLKVFGGAGANAPGASGGDRLPARLASTADIDLLTGGLLVIDGQATAEDDRILVWMNAAPAENGVWLAKAGAWERAPDLEDGPQYDVTGTIYVQEGDTYADRLFKLITDPPVTIDTTAIVFNLESVDGPVAVVAGNSVAWDGSGLKLLKDSGFSADAFIGSFGIPSLANMYVTNTDPRMVSLGGGDVVGPVGALDENVAIYNGISGKIIKDSGVNLSQLRAAHIPCRVATTADVNLAVGGLLVIDGVGPLVAGERVVVWRQAVPTENGIYIVAAGAWVRAADLALGAQFDLTSIVYVQEGATFGDRLFKLITNPTVVVGVTAIVWQLEAVDGPATVVSGNLASWDGTDKKLLKDSGLTEVSVGVVAKSGRFPLNLVISGQSAPYFDTNSTTFQIAAAFIYPGTTLIGTPTKIESVFYRISGAAGTGEIRIFDRTNLLVIALLTGVNTASGVETIQDLGAIANLPAGQAIFEIQIRRQGGGSTWAVADLSFTF